MKKIMLAILVIVLVSGIGITGAVISIQRPSTTLNFNQTTQDALDWRLNIPDDITEYLGETVCDDTICKTPFIIKDSIDTVIEIPKNYCAESFEQEQSEGFNITVCKKTIDYTSQEIKELTDEKIKARLIQIADAEATRKTDSETTKDIIIDSGKIITTTIPKEIIK